MVAAYLWGPQWVSQWVEFFCDNESVVAVRKSGTSWDKSSMVLLCYLTMLAIHHSFSFKVSSVQGKANPVADPLSWFQFQRLRCLESHADPTQYQIPASLLAALQTSVPICPTSICKLLPPGWSCKPGWLHPHSQRGDSRTFGFFISR